MDRSASTRANRATGRSSIVGLAKVMARLTPRQLNDEIGLATAEMKQKGKAAGIAAAFLVVALLFLAALAVALIAAAILGLGTVMPDWLAALLVAALFLVIAAVGALIGVSRFRKTLPLMPEEAIRGLKYDLGVLKEGRRFDPATLDKPKEPKPDKPKDKSAKPDDAPKPSEEELRTRTRQRREHLADVRDGLVEKADIRRQVQAFEARRAAAAQRRGDGSGSSTGDDVMVMIREHWQPLTVLAASLVAMAIMISRLARR